MDLDRKGLLGTILVHVLLLILFLVFGFKTQLPLPGEAGILVNFGDIEDAFGAEEPRYNTEPTPQEKVEEVPEQVEEVTTEETIMTQDYEEAPAVQQKKEVKKKPEKKPEKKVETPKPKKEEPKKEVKPTTNPKALYSGRNTNTANSGSQGVSTGTGNQGSLTGSPDATNLALGGGSGNSPGFYLDGRNALNLPTPVLDVPKQGKVVVEIKVDRDGNVVEARPGAKGSTTPDSYLHSLAKKAALASKFDSKPNAPLYQNGTITYIFSLR